MSLQDITCKESSETATTSAFTPCFHQPLLKSLTSVTQQILSYQLSFPPTQALQVHPGRARGGQPKWHLEHKRFQESHGLDLRQAWSMTHVLPAHLGPRERDVIDFCWASQLKAGMSEGRDLPLKDVLVDVSQSLSRSPWSKPGHLRSIVASSRFYSFHTQKMLTPSQHFRLLGFSCVKQGTLTDPQMYELASQAMVQPVIAVICLALLPHLQ